MTKTNILILHGCNQNSDFIKSLLKTWIKIGKDNIDFHFIQARHAHSLGGYTWYEKELDVVQIGSIKYEENLVLPCLKAIDDYIVKHRITVLMGFSQGGNVIDAYLHQYPKSPIKRTLIFSGYELIYDERKIISTPTLSIYSEVDTVVPFKFRPKNYSNLTEFTHDKGHKLPTGNPLIRKFCNYISTGEWV
jgi:predicted esterase